LALALGPACTRPNPGFLDTDIGGAGETGAGSVTAGETSAGSGTTAGDTGTTDTTGDGDAGDGDGDGAVSPPYCERLDLVFVLDMDDTTAEARGAMMADMQHFVDTVLSDEAHPWADDFHVGVVRAQALANQGACAAAGLHTAAVGSGAGCDLGGGAWVTQETVNPAAAIQCLFEGTVVSGDAPPPLALASARSMGISVPNDIVEPSLLQSCNGGFRREAGMKVLVPVSMRDDAVADAGSPGGPFEWAGWLAPLQNAVWSADGSDLIMNATVPLDFTCSELAANVLSWTSMMDHDIPIDICAVQASDWAAEIDQKLRILCLP
jgi:hypothetical protein